MTSPDDSQLKNNHSGESNRLNSDSGSGADPQWATSPQFGPPNMGQVPPSAAQSDKPVYKRTWFIITAIAASLVILISGAWIAVFQSMAATADRHQEAVAACEDGAIEFAKYPGAAKVVSVETEETRPGYNGATYLTITGEVDFPNGWGTPVRHTFECPLVIIDADGTIDEPYVDVSD